jgi:hypothetical protein
MVKKPKQYEKLHDKIDNADQLEGLEEAMSGIASAMEALSGYTVFEEWFDTLEMVFDEMTPMHEECEAIDAAEYRAEMDGLNRQYLRSVL